MKDLVTDRRVSVIGCMSALWLSAPFGRGAVVLASGEHPDAQLIFNRHDGHGRAGERMTSADWGELVACEEVVELAQPVVLDSATCMPKGWLLRDNFPERERGAEQLRACEGAVIHEEQRDDVLLFIVDESRARELLAQWSRAAFDDAWRFGQRGDWAQAHAYADLAWLTDISLALDRVALLALALEFTEGLSAAEDLIEFETNSRGAPVEDDLRTKIFEFRLALRGRR
jgi:hypothetical protein